MSRDAVQKTPEPNRVWIESIASACFAEELALDSLPLAENVKSEVCRILDELSRLSPLEALSRCISNPDCALPRGS